MRLEVIGADGSKRSGCYLTSMLIGDSLLLDTGSASMIPNEKQSFVKSVLLTHAHLDHILELGFMLDADVATRDTPLKVMGSSACLEIVHKHYMNDLIWPDFSRIRTTGGLGLEYIVLEDRKWLEISDDLSLWVEPVNHGSGARGFILRSKTGSVVYTGDTGPTENIWEKASTLPDLRMVIAEVSFPDSHTDLSISTSHLSPKLLADELRKLGNPEVPVYVFHLKPWFREQIEKDLEETFEGRAVVLKRGDHLDF